MLARPGSKIPGTSQSITILNRLATWTAQGIELEADPRHVEIVLQQLCLESAQSVTAPLVKEKADDADEKLGDEDRIPCDGSS